MGFLTWGDHAKKLLGRIKIVNLVLNSLFESIKVPINCIEDITVANIEFDASFFEIGCSQIKIEIIVEFVEIRLRIFIVV